MVEAEQLTFDRMPGRLFRATPTRLLTWLECPRRYRFSYLDRPPPPKGPPWAHNSLGASVHSALAGWWRLPPERRTAAAAGELLDRAWLTDGYRDDEQSLRWRGRARAMVQRYVERLDPQAEPVGVERTVAVLTPRLALSGRVDRIDRDPDGGLVVVDYKSGRRSPGVDDARGSLALAVYAVAAASTLRRPCRRVELHHLPTGAVAAWEHPPESLQRHLRRADALGGEAAAAEQLLADHAGDPAAAEHRFPPRPGPQCRWCDFADHCPEGRSAYPRRRSWEGLDAAVG